jgi:hypothetical protein
MNFFRRVYRWLYVHVKGHYPAGTLVQFKPRIGFDGRVYWRSSGVPRRNSIGMVIDGWRKNVHPMPPGVFLNGSVVTFDGARYEMLSWELEVIDESR